MKNFNKGWWNCFNSFAAELIDSSPYMKDHIIKVMKGAGITKEEIQKVLYKENFSTKTINFLYEVVENDILK